MKIRQSTVIFSLASILLFSSFNVAFADHVSTGLDVDELWSQPVGARDGYLEFINPTEHPGLVSDGPPGMGTCISFPTTPPGIICTESFTGFTLADGTDIIEAGDTHTTAGDKADFDWVQENRALELADADRHPDFGPSGFGAMGWFMDTPEMSPHIDNGPATAHAHSDEESPPGALPHLNNQACPVEFFEGVDVFSIISTGEDTDSTTRNAALDYDVDFGNTVTGAFSSGVATLVFIPGWTAATGIDDFVARWMPTIPGFYNMIAIEPAFAGGAHDGVTEIDAIKCFFTNVGGEYLTLDTQALFVAGLQSTAIWMLPIISSVVGFGLFVISRKH